jgi:uncharacterized protein (TIGR02246 family)
MNRGSRWGVALFMALAVSSLGSARGHAADAAVDAAADSISIRATVAELDSAWAHGDAERWAAPYVANAEFINILGMLFSDRESMRARHQAIFEGPFRGSRYRGTLRRVRFLGPDAAIADVDIAVTDFRALPPGAQATEPGVLRTRMRHVLQRIDGRWRIVASQNTAILPRP